MFSGGWPPPELAGRSVTRSDIAIRLKRLRLGRPVKSIMMVGLRGLGKTVLLDQMRRDPESDGIQTVRIEAPEGRSLPALLAPALRMALLHLTKKEAATEYAMRGLRSLAGFVSKLKVTFNHIEALPTARGFWPGERVVRKSLCSTRFVAGEPAVRPQA